MAVEYVDRDAIWRDRVRLYDCPRCGRPVFSQHVGEDVPSIACYGVDGGWAHRLEWDDPPGAHGKEEE